MEAKGWKKAVLIATTDATGQTPRAVSPTSSPRQVSRHAVAYARALRPERPDCRGANRKDEGFNPDVIIDATTGTATGTVLRAIKDEGLDRTPVMSSLGNVINAQIAQYSSILPREIYFDGPGFISRDVTPKGPVRDAQQAFYKALTSQGLNPMSASASRGTRRS